MMRYLPLLFWLALQTFVLILSSAEDRWGNVARYLLLITPVIIGAGLFGSAYIGSRNLAKVIVIAGVILQVAASSTYILRREIPNSGTLKAEADSKESSVNAPAPGPGGARKPKVYNERGYPAEIAGEALAAQLRHGASLMAIGLTLFWSLLSAFATWLVWRQMN